MEEFDVDGRPAKQTDEPLSPQQAGEWALSVRKKADPRKAAVERLRCVAGKRRERQEQRQKNLKARSEVSFRVTGRNADADAFGVETSDGRQVLGKSLSNGNIKTGQTVRSFFAPNGQVVIDVKPKGRDIVLPKPQAKPRTEEPDIWPVTSCFLYSRIKPNTEKLTGNGAAKEEEGETSWDAIRVFSGTGSTSYAYGFAERLDQLGDYATASDALNNILKPDRLIVPTGGENASAAKDNAAISSKAQEAITVWFYIGNPADALTNGQIFTVSGPPFHPSAGEITDGGPGYCMEVYRGGVSSGIFPNESMGVGPLTKKLKESFPGLGGRIGYAGRIEKWRIQDYTASSSIAYFRNTPSPTETFQTPIDSPSWYVPGQGTNPWLMTNSSWFQFGWPDPQYIGCASSAWINVETSALTGQSCGVAVPNEAWYWGGDAAPNYGRIDRSNPSGYIGTDGMFVCWQGHKDNAGLAQSFFESFRTYWGISGSVSKLGSCNFYGCEIPGSGGGYPPPPPSDARRFLIDTYGRKAKVFLVCHKQDYEPIEIELPFEYAAVVEEMRILGGGSFGFFTNYESGKTRKTLRTYGQNTAIGDFDPFSLELVHGTLSIDAEFAYINLFYGGERIHEEPVNLPVPIRLAAQGFGSPMTGPGSNYGNDFLYGRRLGFSPVSYIGYYPAGFPQTPEQTGERYARFLKDCWSNCLAIKVKLPTKENKTLTIIATQKYKRGEIIALTSNNPDSEFDNKFLVRDYRTDNLNLILVPQNSEYASFGGLPALMQQSYLDALESNSSNPTNNDIPLEGFFFKNKQDWTAMDWVHYQLQEMPRQFNPLITVLPPSVSIKANGTNLVNIIHDLDTKFGRQARAEKIIPASSFGYNGTFSGGDSPELISQGGIGPESLFTSYKEQLTGNGLIKNGALNKWYRVTPSSFPVFGQLLRNY